MDKINGAIFLGMLESGCANLNNRRNEVNALNVFPVPDGDTGTNMSLTFTSGINEVHKSGAEDLPTVAKTLARGMLMGARGNSGVILSQIFRGFANAVKDQNELTVTQFAEAIMAGAMKAYKAVMRPVEGTILTVVRESGEYGLIYMQNHPETDLNAYMDVLCKEARASLDRTPELLPVLKEARVVDSGGCGLKNIYEGFYAFLEGAPIVEGAAVETEQEEVKASGYRVEFILKLSSQGTHLFSNGKFREALGKLGESITVIDDADVVKARIDSLQPGEVLNLGQRYGDFTSIQIDNLMNPLHPSILDTAETAQEKEFGIITVCAGEGLASLFKAYRADRVISGGQTMNPSTQDFVEAISGMHAKHIFVLPNNSNIIMSAHQAADVSEGKDVIVLETTSIPQGLSACIAFNPEMSAEENNKNMLESIHHVKSGSITYAIKNTTVDGREIHEGDFMGILNKDICLTDTDKVNAACRLLDMMIDESSEIVTLIQGAEANDKELKKVQAYIEKHYDVDVDVQKGMQPVYSFIIGVE